MAKSISIIIPVYNEEHFLRHCLDSIANQSEAPSEVIVVDNNSTDKTVAIARSYPFVKLISETRQGRVYANYTGLEAATSDLLCRIDADVILPKEWVRNVRQFYHLQGEPALFAATSPSRFNNRGGLLLTGMHRVLYFWLARLLLGYPVLFGSNTCLSRSLWQKVRHEVCLRTDLHEDMDMSYHAHRHGVRVLFNRAAWNYVYLRGYREKLLVYAPMFFRVRIIRH